MKVKAARHHDISANVGDGVSIKLPRLRFEVSRRQAERLRDVLNTVLPPAARKSDAHYLLSIAGDVEPELSEPFATDAERVEAAQDYRRAHGDEDGLYRLTLRPSSTVAPVTVDTFKGWELVMPKPRTPVHVGDRVLDPLDGQWREVTKVTGLAVVLADGGTMGIREAMEAEKRLPSEALPS